MNDPPPLRPTGAAPPWLGPLVVTVLMQIALSFLHRLIPVIGPVVTDSAGVPAEWIGHLAALNTVGAMSFLVFGGPLLHRFGPVRSLQIGALIGSAGLMLTLSGNWPLMMLSALLGGLAYGPSPPAGSDILARHAPARHRGVIFSIKQAGVPLGGAAAGLLVPWLVEAFGWQAALAIAGLLAALTVPMVQPWRAPIDGPGEHRARLPMTALLSFASLRRPFAVLRATPLLVRLSFAGFAFAVAQGCLFSFQATFLNVGVGLSLAAAGTLFALSQGVGVPGRIFSGWMADRLGSGARMLMLLGIGSAAMMVATGLMTAQWSLSAMILCSALAGLTVGTWNGVYLAEVAAAAPLGEIAEATSGSTFLTFIGYVVGPPVFSLIVASGAGYGPAFMAAGAMPLVAAVALARIR